MPSLWRVASLLLLFCVALETTVRIDDWSRFGVPLDSRETSMEELLTRSAIGLRPRPGAAFMQFRINTLGYRGDEVSESALRSRPIVVASGASETFGLYETAGHDWPRQMADSLKRWCGGDSVIVLNAAFAGMTLPTVVEDVRSRLVTLHPRVIVYYPSPQHYLYRTVPRMGVVDTGPPINLSRWRSRFRPRIRDAVKRTVPQPILEYLRRTLTARQRASGETPFASVPVDRLDSLESQLRVLVGEVRHGGSVPVLVVHQHRFSDTSSVVERRWLRALEGQVPKATGEVFMRFEHEAAVRVRRVAADSGVTLVDPAMTARADVPSLFADFAHFTDRGAGVMGEAVAAQLAPLLGCSRSR